jgi:site-specific DNA-methyltransferase (adenine-specific)
VSYHSVHIMNILVHPNRQRKIFNDSFLKELAASIEKHGLLNPPVCHLKDGTFILAAGECRIRAMKILHAEGRPFSHMGDPVRQDHCPILFYHELDEISAKYVELEENLRRTDLTWQERANAIKELHDLQAPGSTFSQTASVMANQYNTVIDPSKVKTMVLLSEHLHHPEVKAARTEKDAIKQMYRVVERDLNIQIGALSKTAGVDFRFGDALEEMKKLPDSSINVILTDPPYGVDADKMGFASFVTANHQYGDSWATTEELLEKVAYLTYRKAADSAHLYLFCDIRKFFRISDIFHVEDWEVWPTPLIWSKGRGPIPSPDYGPMRTYECILFANKGKKQILTPLPDLIYHPLEPSRDHAAQKPVELYTNLLKRSAKQGDTVLDPFCGSGTIFLAAKDLSLSAIGIDNDPAMAAVIQRRTKP